MTERVVGAAGPLWDGLDDEAVAWTGLLTCGAGLCGSWCGLG